MNEGKRKYHYAVYVTTLAFLALFWGKLTSPDAAIIIGIAAGLFPVANAAEHIARAIKKPGAE
jgi:hypothetical protein